MRPVATNDCALDRFRAAVESLKVHHDLVDGPSLKKPLLLLLVISQLETGALTDNKIRFANIEGDLAKLISDFGRRTLRASPSPEQPFERLQTSPLWTLHAQDHRPLRARSLSRSALRDINTYASLDNEIFLLLRDSRDARRAAAKIILDKWCPQERHQDLLARLHLAE